MKKNSTPENPRRLPRERKIEKEKIRVVHDSVICKVFGVRLLAKTKSLTNKLRSVIR